MEPGVSHFPSPGTGGPLFGAVGGAPGVGNAPSVLPNLVQGWDFVPRSRTDGFLKGCIGLLKLAAMPVGLMLGAAGVRPGLGDRLDRWLETRHDNRLLRGLRVHVEDQYRRIGQGHEGVRFRGSDLLALDGLKARVGSPEFRDDLMAFRRRLALRPQQADKAGSHARELLPRALGSPDALLRALHKLPPSSRFTPQGIQLFEAMTAAATGAKSPQQEQALRSLTQAVGSRLYVLLLNDAADAAAQGRGDVPLDEAQGLRRLCDAFNFVAPRALETFARDAAMRIDRDKLATAVDGAKANAKGLQGTARDAAMAKAGKWNELAESLTDLDAADAAKPHGEKEAVQLRQTMHSLRSAGLLRSKHFSDQVIALRRCAGDPAQFAALKAKLDQDQRKAEAQRDTKPSGNGMLGSGVAHWWPRVADQMASYLDMTARLAGRTPMVAAGGHFELYQVNQHRLTGGEAYDFMALERLQALGLDLARPEARQALQQEAQAEFFNLLVSEYRLEAPPDAATRSADLRNLMSRALNSALARRQFEQDLVTGGQDIRAQERAFRMRLLDQVHQDLQRFGGLPEQHAALEKSLSQAARRIDHGDFVNLYFGLRLKLAEAFDAVAVHASGFAKQDYESSFATFAAIQHGQGKGLLNHQADISAVWKFNQDVGEHFSAFWEEG